MKNVIIVIVSSGDPEEGFEVSYYDTNGRLIRRKVVSSGVLELVRDRSIRCDHIVLSKHAFNKGLTLMLRCGGLEVGEGTG